MHVYEVTPGIYKIFSQIASLKTYSTGYFSIQQNETGYFCGMTLEVIPPWLLKYLLGVCVPIGQTVCLHKNYTLI